ncbi:MAG TPA: response regulator [Chloroflexota bacterium]
MSSAEASGQHAEAPHDVASYEACQETDHSRHEATILVVDDTPSNIEVVAALLEPLGYHVVGASSGREALEMVRRNQPDLILLDMIMPGMDGYEVCRQIRADPATSFVPVVLMTASTERDRIRAIELGADDFLTKPLHHAELRARVKSLMRIKTFHDTIQAQAAQLAEWNQRLEERVRQQIDELERVGRLRRFLPPQLADVIVSSGNDAFLESHRREITVVFCDLRGFTRFTESTEPEDMIRVLRAYHEAMGEEAFRFGGTVGRFAGDGLMIFFNDPVPCPDPAARAVRMAVAMRGRMDALIAAWGKLGYELGFGVGIALGHATLARLGFEDRFEYEPNGRVVNLAARLCDQAQSGQILIDRRVYAEVEELVEVVQLGDLALKGFARPMPTYNVIGLKQQPDSPA